MKRVKRKNANKENRLYLPNIAKKDSLPRRNLSANHATRDKIIEISENTQGPLSSHKPQQFKIHVIKQYVHDPS